MKNKIIAIALLSAGLLSSCATMGDFGSATSANMGVPTQVLPATVVSVEEVTQETSSTAKNIGTAIGGLVGAGAGQLLGKGQGRIVSTAGLGAAGALAGRYLIDAMGRTKAQRITVRVDATGGNYTFVQPIYKQHGAIAPGTHGMYYHGNNAHFVPDGASSTTFGF